ncbi:MAG: hypothetical protein Q4B85_13800 [Lachnospiraceae bacterium]|nr:hypothetical protein [Lachnospiraceae bacterium]
MSAYEEELERIKEILLSGDKEGEIVYIYKCEKCGGKYSTADRENKFINCPICGYPIWSGATPFKYAPRKGRMKYCIYDKDNNFILDHCGNARLFDSEDQAVKYLEFIEMDPEESRVSLHSYEHVVF